MKTKKQVSIGLLSILIAGGLDPLVGLCQTSGLTESSRILNEAVQKNSGEAKMPEGTSVNTDSTPSSETENTDTTAPKVDVTPESSEALSTPQENPSSQAEESSSKIKEDTTSPTTSEAPAQGDVDEQNAQPKATENIDDWMPDKALQNAVATSLGVTIDQVTKESMLNLRILSGERLGIVNLTGLEYAKNLDSIILSNNQISDVSPLQNLTSLMFLHLFHNQISDISPLQNLTSLKNLNLEDNQISDVSPLQNLTSLMLLGLRTNQISDISPLHNLLRDRFVSIFVTNQHLQLPAVYVSNKNPYFISIESPIKNITSTKPVILSPLNTSVWTGVGQSGKVEWTAGTQVPAEGTFSTNWKFSEQTNNSNIIFNGTYEQPYILSKVEVNAHDSTLYTGDTWNAQDNFDGAKDKNGNPVNFQDVQVTGTVDTTQPGKYKVTYSYSGVQKEIEVTVLQKDSKENSTENNSNSNSNSNSGENKGKEVLKTLSTNEKNKVLPSTGEKGSVWLFVSGVMLFIFASVIALLRFKKSK